jgi:hypothetical protein
MVCLIIFAVYDSVTTKRSMLVELIEAFRQHLARGEQPAQVFVFSLGRIIDVHKIPGFERAARDLEVRPLVDEREVADAVAEFAWHTEKWGLGHIWGRKSAHGCECGRKVSRMLRTPCGRRLPLPAPVMRCGIGYDHSATPRALPQRHNHLWRMLCSKRDLVIESFPWHSSFL